MSAAQEMASPATTMLVAAQPANDVALARLPKISLSTLAKAMGPITVAELGRLLEGHKNNAPGPRRSYQQARSQAIAKLVDGIGLDVERATRPHEKEAVAALAKMDLDLPNEIYAERVRGAQPWLVGGVCVSMVPDVILDGQNGHGAIKVVFTKERLARGVGTIMASLLWHWSANVLQNPKTKPDLSRVYEPRLPWIHTPSLNPEKQIKRVQRTCQLIAGLWAAV